MVTARMPREKKEAVGRILNDLGTNASETVNRLYDYVLAHRSLPFDNERSSEATGGALLDALAFIDGLSHTSRFSTMTDDEIARERAIARGLVDPDSDARIQGARTS